MQCPNVYGLGYYIPYRHMIFIHGRFTIVQGPSFIVKTPCLRVVPFDMIKIDLFIFMSLHLNFESLKGDQFMEPL